MVQYDYLVVGAGLFGATFAYEAAKRGKRVKVIEKRSHIAGNIYTKKVDGIQVHEYGAHIFISWKKILVSSAPGWSPVVAPQMAIVPPGRTDLTE